MCKKSKIIRLLIKSSAFITFFILISLVGYILFQGVMNIKLSMFSVKYTTENASMLPAIINTIILTFISILISSIIGVFSAIYLSEYSNNDSKLVKIIGIAIETLAGIPSIVYGLFGYLFFGVTLKLGYSILSGALTMSIMVLPLIIRTSEEAIKGVEPMYKEGSYGLGATKIRTIFKIIIPSAMPGILSGIVLAIGRVFGETAALMYTAGTIPEIASNIFSSGRTLSVHMYSLLSEGLYEKEAYSAAVIMLVITIFINILARTIENKLRS